MSLRPSPRSGAPAAIAALAVALVSCGGDSAVEVAVSLQTDLVPGADFVGVEMELRTADGTGDSRVVDERATLSLEPSYVRPRQLTTFGGVDEGRYVLIAQLVNGDGEVTAARRVRADVQHSMLVPVVIQSACADVSCPGEGDDPAATECLDGTCVPPECATGEEPECPSGVECAASSDCASTVECAEPTCEEGVCLSVPDDARCAMGERCDVRMGCTGGAGCTDGDTRQVECAMCGSQTQLCGPDGTWTDDGACTDQGACAPGETQMETSAGCLGDGTRRRSCTNECTWSDWTCDAGEIRLWVHPSGGTEWQAYELDPGSSHAPDAPIRASFDVDSADEAYVLTDSSYHVMQTDDPAWTRSGPLGDVLAAVDGTSILFANSVPGRHSGTPGNETVTITVEEAGSTRAEQYDYDAATQTFSHRDTVDPCCDDSWEGASPPATADVHAQWLDVDNVDGWPEPSRSCASGSTAEVYFGVLADGEAYVQDAGSCFEFVQRTSYGLFPPFSRPGAPSANAVGATFWHEGLYVLRAEP